MASPSLNEITRQTSIFLKEKIKTIRLALTDVTPIQLLTEEATNGDTSAPDTRTLGLISRAAFEVDDYWRIVDILHKRLSCFDRRNWRASYKTLIVLERLLTHGPKRVAEEFQIDKDVLREMTRFQFVDERGFNWGSTVGNKSESILKMLEDMVFLEEERARTRKLTCGIKGFGSFGDRSSSVNGSLKDLAKCNSLFSTGEDTKTEVFAQKDTDSGKIEPCVHRIYGTEKMAKSFGGRSSSVNGSLKDLAKCNSLFSTGEDTKTEVFAQKDTDSGKIEPYVHRIYGTEKTAESKKPRSRIGEEFRLESNHPFCDDEQQSGYSLLASIK